MLVAIVRVRSEPDLVLLVLPFKHRDLEYRVLELLGIVSNRILCFLFMPRQLPKEDEVIDLKKMLYR